MKHHMKFGANPRLMVIPALMLILAGAAVLFFFSIGILAGVIASALVAFLDFRLGKLLWSMLVSGIETGPDGASVRIRNGTRYFLPIPEISLAGLYSDEGRPAVFLYAEAKDQFFACADIFTHFAELEAWLRTNTPFEDHADLDMPAVKAMLKSRYGDDTETPEEGTAD